MSDFTNDQLHASSFLQGHNAEYVEQLYAQYVANPASVDADWAEFFAALGDDIGDVTGAAAGPSWARPDWPPAPNDELTAALDGQWAEDQQMCNCIFVTSWSSIGPSLTEHIRIEFQG